MATKAHQLDQRYNGILEGEIGPVGRRLAAFGPVRSLVVGHFAEGSEHMEALLTGAAHSGSMKHCRDMRAREPSDVHGTLSILASQAQMGDDCMAFHCTLAVGPTGVFWA